MKKEISKSKVMELILQACPSYKKQWDEYVQKNYKNGDEQLLYIDLANFATYFVDLYKHNKISEFPSVFDVIELLLTNGDDFVKEAASIGLLEDLQNRLLNNEINTNVFNQYLKQESLKWWNHLNDLWDGKTNLCWRSSP
ncbi:DUF7674 family protein [Paenibacillus glycanilyticus]|uniref:DUF7674 domain-containing protein n=1 Tax=Paenibacillus glycanilyticus TaxID=126569 RepID=A0ABQ6G6H6_9BACL|nr:hypothetical protein [Paenibacillus glycanilyticus]GLX66594.1 hypothetical protein MU1_09380 [Paenibacillus glycanilyticus]